jgi:hypothetical protein
MYWKPMPPPSPNTIGSLKGLPSTGFTTPAAARARVSAPASGSVAIRAGCVTKCARAAV